MGLPGKKDKVIRMYLDSPHHGTWIWQREDKTYYAQRRYSDITFYNVHIENNQWIFDEKLDVSN